MLKRMFSIVVLALAALALPALQGCAGPNALVTQVQGDRATVGKVLASTAAVRDLVTVALNTGKIKAADAENLRTQINVVRQGADIADGLVKNGEAGADARIAALQASIDGIRAYLISQGAKP